MKAAELTQPAVGTPSPGATSSAVTQPTASATVITPTATPILAATLPLSKDSRRGARVKATRNVPRVNSLAVLAMNAASISTELNVSDHTTAVVAPPAPRIASSDTPSLPCRRAGSAVASNSHVAATVNATVSAPKHGPQPEAVEQHEF